MHPCDVCILRYKENAADLEMYVVSKYLIQTLFITEEYYTLEVKYSGHMYILLQVQTQKYVRFAYCDIV